MITLIMILQAGIMICTFLLIFVFSTSGSCRNAEQITRKIQFPQQPFGNQVYLKKRHYDDMYPFPLPFSTIVRRTEKRSNKQTEDLTQNQVPHLANYNFNIEDHSRLKSLMNARNLAAALKKSQTLMEKIYQTNPQTYYVKRSNTDFENYPNLPFSTIVVRRGKIEMI